MASKTATGKNQTSSTSNRSGTTGTIVPSKDPITTKAETGAKGAAAAAAAKPVDEDKAKRLRKLVAFRNAGHVVVKDGKTVVMHDDRGSEHKALVAWGVAFWTAVGLKAEYDRLLTMTTYTKNNKPRAWDPCNPHDVGTLLTGIMGKDAYDAAFTAAKAHVVATGEDTATIWVGPNVKQVAVTMQTEYAPRPVDASGAASTFSFSVPVATHDDKMVKALSLVQWRWSEEQQASMRHHPKDPIMLSALEVTLELPSWFAKDVKYFGNMRSLPSKYQPASGTPSPLGSSAGARLVIEAIKEAHYVLVAPAKGAQAVVPFNADDLREVYDLGKAKRVDKPMSGKTYLKAMVAALRKVPETERTPGRTVTVIKTFHKAGKQGAGNKAPRDRRKANAADDEFHGAGDELDDDESDDDNDVAVSTAMQDSKAAPAAAAAKSP